MAAGLMQLLEPMVLESDARVQGVMESQAVLYREVDRLCAALEPFQDSPQPPDFDTYMRKLSGIRARVGALQGSMQTILPRLKTLQAMVEPGGKYHALALKGKAAAAATTNEGVGLGGGA